MLSNRLRDSSEAKAKESLQVFSYCGHNFDSAVSVLAPSYRNFLDSVPSLLGDKEEFRIEEPVIVLDHWYQLMHDLSAHGLEPALGVVEAGTKHTSDD